MVLYIKIKSHWFLLPMVVYDNLRIYNMMYTGNLRYYKILVDWIGIIVV